MTLSTDTLVAIGSLIGGLIGAIGWLFKAMIKAKDLQIGVLTEERDYWRDVVLQKEDLPEWEAWQQHRHQTQQRPIQ